MEKLQILGKNVFPSKDWIFESGAIWCCHSDFFSDVHVGWCQLAGETQNHHAAQCLNDVMTIL